MAGFSSFKNRTGVSDAFLKEAEKKPYADEEGFWKLTVDKDKGGVAKIRFLPPKDGTLPYAKVYSHFFKGDDGRWCIVDRCPRTYGEDCPICTHNYELYNVGTEEAKARARLRKARVNYIFNIYVIDDKNVPANNGKVFLFKTGPLIYKIITDAMKPSFDEEPKKPFEIYNGHNFILRGRIDPSRANLPNYDKSSFEDFETDLAPSDVELEKIYNEIKDFSVVKENGHLSQKAILEKFRKAYCSESADKIVDSMEGFAEPDDLECDTFEGEVKKESPAPSPISSGSESSSSGDIEDELEYFKHLTDK